MTTIERQLRSDCPHSYRNGNEGWICKYRPNYNGSNIVPPTRHWYSHKKCNGCFLMYK